MKTHKASFDGFFQDVTEFKHPCKEGGGISNTIKGRRGEKNNSEYNDTNEYLEFIHSFNKKLNIVDFGGGEGGHYFIINDDIRKNIQFHVVDVPTNFNEKEIHYYTDIKDIKIKPDIIYSNASIYMYTHGTSSIKNIDNFCQLDPEYIFLQKTIFAIDGKYDHFYTFFPTQSFYYSILSDKKLKEILNNYGYNLEYQKEFWEPTRFNILNAPKDVGDIRYQDLLFKKIKI